MVEFRRALFAEFFATAVFVYMGCGSAVSTGSWLSASNTATTDVARLLPIACAFGWSIMILAYSVAHLSGAHINPAVTLAFLVLKKISPMKAGAYMLVQLIGAIMGSLFLWASCNHISTYWPAAGTPPYSLGANGLSPHLSAGNGFVFEMCGTFLLVFVVLLSAMDKRAITKNLAPFAIGTAVLVAHIILVPQTGCGINPARTMGPAIVNSFAGNNTWDNGWIYYIGPIVGSLLAAGVAHFLFDAACDDNDKKTDGAAESATPANKPAATSEAIQKV
jgi:MIP family channel proteins